MSELALDIRGLHVEYRTRAGYSTALEDATLTVAQGEVVALVGESGSGKTTLGMAALGLLAGNAEARYESLVVGGVTVEGWWDPVWKQIRGDAAALVPQDPGVSLNPVRRIGSQMVENLVSHRLATRAMALSRAAESLARVGIDRPELRLTQYPHELSGGQQQRVLIAMAFSSNPKLIVADEPTSGLDVTVQRVVLDQLDALRTEHGTAVLFITHDLAVAAERADRIVVLQGGRIVEHGVTAEVLADPRHEYTRTLLAAAPSFSAARLAPARLPIVPASRQEEALLTVTDAVKTYNRHSRDRVTAVDGVSIRVPRGSTVGVVGESGSGKSTLARLLVSLERADSGDFRLAGETIPDRGFKALRQLHRRVQLVYQNPYASLDPRFTVGQTVAEPLHNFERLDRRELQSRVATALDDVALPASYAKRYPSELSGGQRQRVSIARSLILRPELVVLDEPVSALDVSVQAQILQLLVDLQAEHGLTYVFISHDLSVVRLVADTVYVLADGKVVEHGGTEDVFERPKSDYTVRLIDAIPGRTLRVDDQGAMTRV
ncbi:MAG: transporter ATP-binding protein [Microbacteriaceae bacterium]|nr:transporter ATP-binding protein [Microbacteriaceae bacterium]